MAYNRADVESALLHLEAPLKVPVRPMLKKSASSCYARFSWAFCP